MELTVTSVLLFCLLLRRSAEGIPLNLVAGLERALRMNSENATDGSISIHIADHPDGHILFIQPSEVSTINGTVETPLMHESQNCSHAELNKTMADVKKNVEEIASKLRSLEWKLERRLIHDQKSSPNVFFVAPGEAASIDQSRWGQKPTARRVEWMIPQTDSTSTTTLQPPPRNLFTRDTIQLSTTLPPETHDLLNRAKRRSEKKQSKRSTKPKAVSLCARITPVVGVTQNTPYSSYRRSKRTRRDVSSGENGLEKDVTVSELVRDALDYGEHWKLLGQLQNSPLKMLLANVPRDGTKVDDVKLFYHELIPVAAMVSRDERGGFPGRKVDDLIARNFDKPVDYVSMNQVVYRSDSGHLDYGDVSSPQDEVERILWSK